MKYNAKYYDNILLWIMCLAIVTYFFPSVITWGVLSLLPAISTFSNISMYFSVLGIMSVTLIAGVFFTSEDNFVGKLKKSPLCIFMYGAVLAMGMVSGLPLYCISNYFSLSAVNVSYISGFCYLLFSGYSSLDKTIDKPHEPQDRRLSFSEFHEESGNTETNPFERKSNQKKSQYYTTSNKPI